MNPDSGEAEAPTHPHAMSWRRDLDYAIRRSDQVWENEQREAARALLPSEEDRRKFDSTFFDNSVLRDRNAVIDANPAGSTMMRRLLSGEPISRGSIWTGR